MPIYVILPSMHFVEIVFAEIQQGIALAHREAYPLRADCASCCEHLREQGFAFPAGPIKAGRAGDWYPIRRQPLPWRDRDFV